MAPYAKNEAHGNTMRTHLTYFRAGGNYLVLFIVLFFFIIAEVCAHVVIGHKLFSPNHYRVVLLLQIGGYQIGKCMCGHSAACNHPIVYVIWHRAICSETKMDLVQDQIDNSSCEGTAVHLFGGRICSVSYTSRIAIYIGLILSSVFLNLLRGMLFYLVCINASCMLHRRMFMAVLRTPLLFFDNNPSGEFM